MLAKEVWSGILLLLSTVAALLISNSFFYAEYSHLIHSTVEVSFNDYGYKSSFLHFVNEGLMAIFFFHVGLEIKHAFVCGDLQGRKKILLPGVAALGGMIMPALIYCVIVGDLSNALQGWAIPVATDIAFSLGLFMLFSKSMPLVLRVFLISLATFDDIGAIIIIAAYYTSDLSIYLLAFSLVLTSFMLWLNIRCFSHIGSYILLGFLQWCLMLESGMHATLSGVLVALLIPITSETKARLEDLEQLMYPWVYYCILPIFAFLNAGVSLGGYSITDIVLTPISMAIWLGLSFGKPLGIFVFVFIARLLDWVELPKGVDYGHIIGVGFLCGIGFTMSLFIANLAFYSLSESYEIASRGGILFGSCLSALFGSAILALRAFSLSSK